MKPGDLLEDIEEMQSVLVLCKGYGGFEVVDLGSSLDSQLITVQSIKTIGVFKVKAVLIVFRNKRNSVRGNPHSPLAAAQPMIVPDRISVNGFR